MSNTTVKTLTLDLNSTGKAYDQAKTALTKKLRGYPATTVKKHVETAFNTLLDIYAYDTIQKLYDIVRQWDHKGLSKADKVLRIKLHKVDVEKVTNGKKRKGKKVDKATKAHTITRVEVTIENVITPPKVVNLDPTKDSGKKDVGKAGKPHSNPKGEVSAPQNHDNKQDKITAQAVKNDFAEFLNSHTKKASAKLIAELLVMATKADLTKVETKPKAKGKKAA